MATPMRHGPSQQGRTPSQYPGAAPTPQASTPFSNSQAAAALSPHGPRSSPQQFKKSPATTTSATMSATMPLGQQQSQPVNFDSPSTAAALGAMGIHDLNLDNISVGGLAASAGRTDEEERNRRLEAVIDMLDGFDSGRVSSTSLERLAGNLGLEFVSEQDGRILLMAGKLALIEIGIENHVVHSVLLTSNEPISMVDRHKEKLSAILEKDLKLASGQLPFTKKLKSFKANLERFATLDRLSVIPGLNCFEAVAGVWESLQKLHEWDVEKLRQDPEMAGKSADDLRMHSLAHSHGCPLMHARGRLGLSLDYWKERRFCPDVTIDSDDTTTWSILLACAPASSMVYNAVRVSNKWIGPDIEKSSLTNEEMMSMSAPVLDWLEPANTLLPPSQETKADGNLESNPALLGPRPPDVIFMAHFDPPIVVPQLAAMEIYKIAAVDPTPATQTFDACLFPLPEGTIHDPSDPREMSCTQKFYTSVQNFSTGQKHTVWKTHMNTLLVDKPIYGQTLKHIPITHPKDLVAMLPIARQYAFLSLLLNNSFKDYKPPEAKPNTSQTQAITTARDEFMEFISEANTERAKELSNATKVDMVLIIHPVPRLQLVFPFRETTGNITLEIQVGGRVHIVSDNVFDQPAKDGVLLNGRGSLVSAEKWAKGLEIIEHIGMWVERIKQKLE
ncbi:mediator of RNA polymerase II transcription subunit 1-domain-containing protein [Xylariaceae sp. FL0016]|nr:mediator of RNA polymerase II transcription subunit 1-domain-containing protein [Xylariaceae sp. FL0016]